MSNALLVSTCIAFALLLPVAHAQQAAAPTATSTAAAPATSAVAQHAIHATAVYRDTHGKPIDQAAFAKAMQAGQHFKMRLSKDHKHAIMTLLPAGVGGGMDLVHAATMTAKAGQPLPDFQLPTLAGKPASLASLAGKPTLVDLFFADCIGCIEELPAMNAYLTQHPHMHFLAITFDDAKTARDFARTRHFVWPVAYAGGTYLNKTLKASVYPTLFLLDGNGKLLATHIGSLPTQSTQPPSAQSAAKAIPGQVVIHTTTTAATTATPLTRAEQQSQVQWLDGWVKQHLASSKP